MIEAEARRRKMAAALSEAGQVRSPRWQAAVECVPRHLLVPSFYAWGEHGYELVDGSVPDQRERWLSAVYDREETLVTEYDPETEYATSSSTMPAIVLPMLEALEVEPGKRVLDVGLGSGYSTALLCCVAGEGNVTGVDAGADVVRLARARLERAGYRPLVACGDGLRGYASRAPYDRIVSMVTVRRVPGAWVEQLAPAGVIVVTLPDACFCLRKQSDGIVEGRYLANYSFMWHRQAPRRERTESIQAWLLAAHGADGEFVGPRLERVWGDKEAWGFWAIARLLHYPYGEVVPLGGPRVALVDMTDQSWLLVDRERETVVQSGPRRLWEAVESLHGQLRTWPRWEERSRLGLSVRPDGSQFVWLDSPDSEHRWKL